MENKKFAVVLIIIILFAVAAGAYYLGLKQSQGGTKAALHTAVTCMQDFGLEQKKTDASVITNPMENLPEVNPFDKVKTNPFE